MWCSVSDDKREEDVNEQILEGAERQTYLKDTDRAGPRSNGKKGRKEAYANRNISWQREVVFFSFFVVVVSAETFPKDTVRIALALYSQTGQEAGACPGREYSSHRDCHHQPGSGLGKWWPGSGQPSPAWMESFFPSARQNCTAVFALQKHLSLSYVCYGYDKHYLWDPGGKKSFSPSILKLVLLLGCQLVGRGGFMS